jgi:hypothetical protein
VAQLVVSDGDFVDEFGGAVVAILHRRLSAVGD